MAAKKEDNYSDEMRKSENMVMKFIKKHIVVLLLVLVIIGLFFYSMIRVNMLERTHEEKTEKLIYEHKAEIDSLNISNMKFVTEVFSWSIRSELIRNNREEVNHLFNELIKVLNVIKVQLIDPESFEITMSTDKKDEGEVVPGEDFNVNRLVKKEYPGGVMFINPVMGHNILLGILVVKIKVD